MTTSPFDLTSRGRRRPRLVRYGHRAPLALICLLSVLGQAGCISVSLLGVSADAPLEQSVVSGIDGPKLLLLEIDGLISGSEAEAAFLDLGTTSMVARVREVLDEAREDQEIRGVLLRIDSPGGTATASDQIYAEIERFKNERKVPVVAQLLGTAASGGYYVAMSADMVQAHRTTVVGSIGVIFTSVNFAGLMDKLGIEDQTVMAGEYKDIGSPFRPLTSEERTQLQSIVDDLHARFREVVERGRPGLSAEEVVRLANGSIYSAPQALENGLVDRVGSLNEAVDELARRVGASQVRVVAYQRPGVARRNIYMRSYVSSQNGGYAAAIGSGGLASASRDALGSVAVSGLRGLLERPGFHYLWWPGLASP
jgi:protease-4